MNILVYNNQPAMFNNLILNLTIDEGPISVIIGTQEWRIKNVDVEIVGDRVLNDDEANREIFGGLYTWYMIADIEAAYPGWHVCTLAEIQTLATYLGGWIGAGGKLKEAGLEHWDSPNTGATNSTGWTALPGGMYHDGDSQYYDWGILAYYHTATSHDGSRSKGFLLSYNSANFFITELETKVNFLSFRLIKD